MRGTQAVPGIGPFRGEALFLIAQRGCCHAAATGHFADRQRITHGNQCAPLFDFKCT